MTRCYSSCKIRSSCKSMLKSAASSLQTAGETNEEKFLFFGDSLYALKGFSSPSSDQVLLGLTLGGGFATLESVSCE